MERLDEIFRITYGSQLDLNKCEICGRGEGYNFVNRSSVNCGVSARILKKSKKEPFKAGCITTAMGGSVLASFVQQEDFYTGQNVKVLVPPEDMSLAEKLFYCQCIEANRFRFSTFGREANYSFNSMLVPSRDEVSNDIKRQCIDNKFEFKPLLSSKLELNMCNWKWFVVNDLFKVVAGKYHYPSEYSNGDTPYISATIINNGIGQKIDIDAEFSGGAITTEKVKCTAFFQPIPFCATSDVNILRRRDGTPINKYIGLFLASVIDFNENYRWTYGRQCRVGDTKAIKLKLPAIKNAKGEYEPDWQWMEDYIKGLPYSGCL
ncbi:MAG: restriction endonuclease subunit S [Bacteroidales bacterium]|nr:restriction endonuclease subunit S [Bacteroidales bacterium]